MENIQQKLFNKIRASASNPAALVDELVSILDISKDSAYRRIKGDKQLSFDELVAIAKAYHFSLDELLDLWHESIVFRGDYVDGGNFNMESYLESMLSSLQQMKQFDNCELFYLTKDFPIFYYLMIPEVAAFKFFVWTKTQMQFEEMREKKFSFDILTPKLLDLSRQIAELYTRIPSSELLNADNILNDLRQLEYYKDTLLISSNDDLAAIYNGLDKMVNHMEEQAALGKKFLPGTDPDGISASYKLFVNDFYVGDNTLIARAGDLKLVYVNHSAINYVYTSSKSFVEYNEEFLNNMFKRSSLISEVGERTRTRFFNLIHERISTFKAGLMPNSF